MPAISGIDTATLSQINGQVAQASGKKDTATELSDNFMTLLVAQLQNQDPMNPMENAQLTSQLAQINTVGGIDKLNNTMQAINGQIEMGQSIQASGLIGKNVLVPGNQILAGAEGTPTPFGIEMDQGIADSVVTVVDGNGVVVRTLETGALNKGVNLFDWDGKTDNGERVAAGSYRFNVQTKGEDGEFVESRSLSYAKVNGVVSDGSGSPRLDLGGVAGDVGLSDIRKIL